MRLRLSAALALVGLLTVTACGGNPTPTVQPAAPALPSGLSAAGPLLDSVTKAVPGLSQAQSILGVGSMLGFAKGKMTLNDFNQVSAALPGSEALIGEALNQGMPSTLDNVSDLTSFLGNSGISSNQVNQIASTLGKMIGGKTTPALGNSFVNVFK